MEEEGLSLPNRSADGIAEDVPLEGRNRKIRTVEKVLRVELFVAQIFKSRSMKGIGALLGNPIDDDSRITAIFGAKGVRLDFEFLNTLDVRLEGDLVLHHVAQIDPVKEIICGVFASTGSIDAGDPNPAWRRQERPSVRRGNDGARRHQRQVEEESAVERNVDQIPALNDIS